MPPTLTLKGRTKASPVRKVCAYLDDQNGMLSHGDPPEGKDEAQPVFTLDMRYLSPTDLEEIMTNAVVRRVSNPKKRTKANDFDTKKSRVDTCVGSVSGWDMTVAGLRALHVPHDLSEFALTDRIPFKADELVTLAEISRLGAFVSTCMADYDFWFPDERSQEGNSPSGPGSSSGD